MSFSQAGFLSHHNPLTYHNKRDNDTSFPASCNACGFCTLVMTFDNTAEHAPPRLYGDPRNVTVCDFDCQSINSTFTAYNSSVLSNDTAGANGANALGSVKFDDGPYEDEILVMNYSSSSGLQGRPWFAYKGNFYGNSSATVCSLVKGKGWISWSCPFVGCV